MIRRFNNFGHDYSAITFSPVVMGHSAVQVQVRDGSHMMNDSSWGARVGNSLLLLIMPHMPHMPHTHIVSLGPARVEAVVMHLSPKAKPKHSWVQFLLRLNVDNEALLIR